MVHPNKRRKIVRQLQIPKVRLAKVRRKISAFGSNVLRLDGQIEKFLKEMPSNATELKQMTGKYLQLLQKAKELNEIGKNSSNGFNADSARIRANRNQIEQIESTLRRCFSRLDLWSETSEAYLKREKLMALPKK